jgi:hypothetical protein
MREFWQKRRIGEKSIISLNLLIIENRHLIDKPVEKKIYFLKTVNLLVNIHWIGQMVRNGGVNEAQRIAQVCHTAMMTEC